MTNTTEAGVIVWGPEDYVIPPQVNSHVALQGHAECTYRHTFTSFISNRCLGWDGSETDEMEKTTFQRLCFARLQDFTELQQ